MPSIPADSSIQTGIRTGIHTVTVNMVELLQILLCHLRIYRLYHDLMLHGQNMADRIIQTRIGNHTMLVSLKHGIVALLIIMPYQSQIVSVADGQALASKLAKFSRSAHHVQRIGHHHAVKTMFSNNSDHLRRQTGRIHRVNFWKSAMLGHNTIQQSLFV